MRCILKDTTLKIGLACGGTGGHLFPGLATAYKLRKLGHHVVLWLAGKDVEGKAVQNWDGPIITIPSKGYPAKFSFQFLTTTWTLIHAANSCRKLMKKERPDVLLAMGSYASVGPVLAALLLKIPVVLHEANVYPGRTNSLFARWATAVAGTFEETRFYLKKTNIIITGMPLRRELEQHLLQKTNARKSSEEDLTILIMGGSRGSVKLNDVISCAVSKVYTAHPNLKVVHIAGLDSKTQLEQRYQQVGIPHQVFGFVEDMLAIYEQCDFAICRAGAATSVELLAFGVPALLIPYPYATHDHQMINARTLEKVGAVDVVAEKKLDESWLEDYILNCIQNPARIVRMRKASERIAKRNGAESLAKVVEEIGAHA